MGIDERLLKLAKFAAAAQKTYGHELVSVADQIQTLDHDRIPTGSLSMDYVTGGGVPRGRVTMLWGEKSSGKTTHTSRICGNAQNLCRHCWRPVKGLVVQEIPGDERKVLVDLMGDGAPTHRAVGKCDCVAKGIWNPPMLTFLTADGKAKPETETQYATRLAQLKENSFGEFIVMYLDVEGAVDLSWMRRVGVDTRRLWLCRPEFAEQGIDLADTMMRTGEVDLLVIDSLAMLTPMTEIEESTEKWQQGLQARLLNKAVRKWIVSINEMANTTGLPPTMIWIQQVRKKIGMAFGNPNVKPGGEGQGFATSIELFCWASQFKTEDEQIGPTKEDTVTHALDVKLNFKCEKNKTAPAHKTGFYRMSLRSDDEGYKMGDVMEYDYVFEAAKRFGIVTKDGSTYFAGTKQYKTQDAIRTAWRADAGEYRAIQLKILARLQEKEK